MVLIGKKSGNDKVQKHVDDCIGWLNAYFTDVGHVTYMQMPDICVAREMGKLPYWCVEFSFLIYIYIPYIFESNPYPFYSFRGLKNQIRIRIACGLDSWSTAGFWKNDRATVHAVKTIQ